MNKELTNNSILNYINNELSSKLKKEQLSGVVVCSILYGAPLILINPKISIMNIFMFGSIVFNLIMYTILRYDITRFINIYFLYMGISATNLTIILFYGAFRLLMLYAENTGLYLIILTLVVLIAFLFHYTIFKVKIKKSESKRTEIKDYGPIYLTSSVTGIIVAKVLFSGMSQSNLYAVLAGVLIITLFIVIMNIRYLLMYYLLRKNNIKFEELKVDLTNTNLN